MSLDAEIRSVIRALPDLDESQKSLFVEAFFRMVPDLGLNQRLVEESIKLWPSLPEDRWLAIHAPFWAEVNRRDRVRREAAAAESAAAFEALRAAEARRRAEFEAQAIVVPLGEPTRPKMDWARFDKVFSEVGGNIHAEMPDGYGTSEVNSLRAYLKRHWPRLAVSTRKDSTGNKTWVYKKEATQS